MTRIFYTTVILLLITQSYTAKAGINARALIDRDWAFTETTSKKDDGQPREFTLLSLQPTGNNSATGTAWIIKSTKTGVNQFSYQAWRGCYKLFEDSKDQNNLLMHLGFVRKFNGKKESRSIMWSFDLDFEKKGVSVNIPIRNRRVSANKISLSAFRAFFVDSKGMPVFPRNRPKGFLEELTGVGSIKKVTNTEFLSLNETMPMDATSPMVLLLSSGIYKSPPNACKLHCYFGSR